MSFQFITASHSDTILNENLMASDAARHYPIHIQRDFKNVAIAYNKVPKFENYIIYVHHDVFLPQNFMSKVKSAINKVNRMDDNWGVLGVAGVIYRHGKKYSIGHVRDRGKEWGEELPYPAEVDTLDELLLITQGDFKFDENLEQDFYGADICMQSKDQGRKCYAIEAYCHHNSGRAFGGRTESFYRSEKYFSEKWNKYKPIATTCSILT